jgi:hypothetical protein
MAKVVLWGTCMPPVFMIVPIVLVIPIAFAWLDDAGGGERNQS